MRSARKSECLSCQTSFDDLNILTWNFKAASLVDCMLCSVTPVVSDTLRALALPWLSVHGFSSQEYTGVG